MPARTAVAAAAVAAFLAGSASLGSVWRGEAAISDIPVYRGYGDAVEGGAVPYRDLRLEYPPGALVAFVAPSLVGGGERRYARAFAALMCLAGVAAIVLAAVALATLGAGAGRLALGLAPLALSPLLLGPLLLTRFDLLPAALTAGALAALLRGRDRLGAGVLGAAVAVKLYPLVLLPLALAWTARRRGRREALLGLTVCLAAVSAAFLPFLLVAPDGLVQLGALAWLWLRFARGAAVGERLVRFAAAALVAFVALGKVLSPQFLIWLLPAVPLVAPPAGAAAAGLLAAACLLTRGWFPDRYWELVREFDGAATALVAARDLVLLALLAVLALPARLRGRAGGAARSP